MNIKKEPQNDRSHIRKKFYVVFVSLPLVWVFAHSVNVFSASSLQGSDNFLPHILFSEEEQTFLGLKQERGILENELLKGLKDSRRDIRYAAVRLLGYGKTKNPEKAVEILLERLPDEDIWVTEAMLDVLSQLAKKADPKHLESRLLTQLLKYSKAPNPYLRTAAIASLQAWRTNYPEAEEAVVSALGDSLWLVRAQGRFPLDSQSHRIPQLLAKALQDELPNNRVFGIDVLSDYWKNDPHFVITDHLMDLLIERLGDPHGAVIYTSLNLLRALGDGKAIVPLLRLWKKDSRWKKDVRWALQTISDRSFDALVEQYEEQLHPIDPARITYPNAEKQLAALHSKDEVKRISAIIKLAWIGDPRICKPVMQTVTDPSPYIRSSAVKTLALLATRIRKECDKAFTLVLRATKDQDAFVRSNAFQSLGWFRDGTHTGNVLNVLSQGLVKESNLFVRLSIAQTLRQFQTRESGQILLKAFNDQFFAVREQAVAGVNLAHIPDAIESLVKRLEDTQPQVRHAAIWALSPGTLILGGPEHSYLRKKVTEKLKRLSLHDPSQKVREAAKLTFETYKNTDTLSKADHTKILHELK